MIIKKSGKTIFGAELTNAEQKAMEIEIRRQLADYTRKYRKELLAVVLWELRTQLGFGHDRLKQFYLKFEPAIQDMIERYELAESDADWLCTHKLEEYGVNLDEWDKELK
jgi:hypothetical protein